jgi:rubrerythrin
MDVLDELDELEIQALREALDDEYRSWATYDQVVADFGDVAPFVNIREAEARHIEALRGLYSRYRLPWPNNPWPGKVDRYPDVQAACVAAVAGEIANGEMYARLLANIKHSDIRTVLGRLQEASEQRHLAAFQACVRGESSVCAGGGRRHRRHGNAS